MYNEDQYPDKLTRETGEVLPCRFYPNNRSNGVKKIVDGATIDARYAIAMPEDTPQLLVGELISATDERGDPIVYNEPVVLFHHGKFHCVAYV